MRAVRSGKKVLPVYIPDYYADSIAGIDFIALKGLGIECIAFDVDSTLVPFSLLPFKKKVIRPEAMEALLNARRHFKSWIIASNRPTNDLQDLAKSIDAKVVRASLIRRKPRRKYFECVIEKAGVPAHKIAMVGDKLLADVYGAKRMGMLTVWIKRIGRDNPFDMLFQSRRFEKWLIKKYM